ncbi:MAG: T9SS type A sorting domain-containing protein [Bacteroidia bacterium]|nr:T9SS type A sorting domain-containing protein [Bacteroidia bacterium]MCF8427236.1 T9SS type A sorting domain-containing protein [Bacteroidia bacterium]
MNINKFCINKDTLFIGGSKGIWFRPLSQLVSSINRFEPNLNEISVYPNPFTETLNIDWESKNLEATDLQIIDMQGRIIWPKTAFQLPNAINLQGLQPGLYFLKLGQDSTSITKRILKL